MTWFTSEGVRRFGCTCNFNDPPDDRCDGDWCRCNGAIQTDPSIPRIKALGVDELTAGAVMAAIRQFLVPERNLDLGNAVRLFETRNLPPESVGRWSAEIKDEVRISGEEYALLEFLNRVLEANGMNSIHVADHIHAIYIDREDDSKKTFVLYEDQLFLASIDDVRKSQWGDE